MQTQCTRTEGSPALIYKCSLPANEVADVLLLCSPQVGDQLRLVPGHCDPTCNMHDWIVGVRDGVVEAVWPVLARGPGV